MLHTGQVSSSGSCREYGVRSFDSESCHLSLFHWFRRTDHTCTHQLKKITQGASRANNNKNIIDDKVPKTHMYVGFSVTIDDGGKLPSICFELQHENF